MRGDDARRLDVIRLGRSGLDYIDVRGEGRRLEVGIFGRLPDDLDVKNFIIEGGVKVKTIRVTAIRITADDPDAEGAVALRLDRAGDASTYTLRVVGVPAVDPLYATLPFTFGLDNARTTDCVEPPARFEPAGAAPHIDYLAKDYATFRRLLLDRASLVMPDWNEQHIPDLNITLVELLAFVGDQLSYFQDAVATEAYLSTARKRVSVRRHARLLDYSMHDGCNARAWLSLTASADVGPIDPREIVFWTNPTASASAEYFEPIGNAALFVYAAQSAMQLYAWGNHACVLSAGATAATLLDASEPPDANGETQRALRHLQAGVYVLFESISAIADGVVVEADPVQRHVVRLTHVRREIDSLYDTPIVEIQWAAADRLPFDLPIVAPNPSDAAEPPLDLCIAWGNLVAVDHGRTLGAPEALPDVPAEQGLPYRPTLAQPNLTFAEAYSAGSAAAFGRRDPRSAQPQIADLLTTDVEGHQRRWSPAPDLLSSGETDARYVVEIDENAVATLRFGDGAFGRRPPPDATVQARYRVGNGAAGNVGAEAIVNVGFTGKLSVAGLSARNPLPAGGGAAPEAVDDVRILAPTAFRSQIERAIAPDDYAQIAQRDSRLQRAAAEFRWTGSRTLVRVALDPLASEDLGDDLIADVTAALEPVRRIVRPALRGDRPRGHERVSARPCPRLARS
jgi:hypothetical protein